MKDDELLEFEYQAYLARARQERRRLTRAERKWRRARTAAYIFLVAFLAAAFALLFSPVLTAKAEDAPKKAVETRKAEMLYTEETAEEVPALTSLGEFTVTHYCPCSRCCGRWADGITATGTVATEGRTIAVDPDVIPLGSRVAVFYDDGRISYYIAEDTGSQILGNKIDVCIADHTRARELGVTGASVYIVNEVA